MRTLTILSIVLGIYLIPVNHIFACSRLIVGAHWRSDVDADRLVADVIVVYLHAHKDFPNQLEETKKNL